jgi:Mg-chelatase subunit ChlD
LRAAIAGLSPIGGTNIAAALDESAQELAGARGRAEADKVVVLLTDGKDDEPEAVLRAATRLKAALGTQLFTIGFGDVDPMVMVRAASSPEDNYYAPDASTLGDIYAEIARRLSATVLARQLQISDTLPANMRYLGPAGGPAPRVSGQVLTWDLVDLPFGGIDLAYRVEPLALGRHPTNVEALADFRDGLDEPGSLRFPVPEVMVVNVAPTPTSTSTPFPTPTPKPPATATPRPPEPIFLPIAVWQTCRDRTVLADVVLVIDTSGSMNAPASGSDGPTRLEAAVDAAARFVDGLLSGGSGNRVALVSFNLEARLDQPLTTDGGAVRAALAALATVQGTRIDRGIEVAAAELTGERASAANSRVLVLLTDGRVDDVEDSVVIDAAGRAKEAGILLVAIGLGDAEAVDFELLGAVASGPDLVFRAPSASDLAAIYAQIAYTIECPNLDWP